MTMLTITSRSTVMIRPDPLAQAHAALKAAALDLARDLESAIGCRAVVKDGEGHSEGQELCIKICINEEGFPGFAGPFGHREQYRYTLDSKCRYLTITGSDHLGALWGIYNISEEYLRINPFAPFLGAPSPKVEAVSIPETEASGRPVFAYRGWFFNDEDLITGWCKPAGVRSVDYLFYSRIMNHQTVDEIAEAALRNRLNILIPASFQDIDCPADEENIKRITGRGLYISQHHIEPLGVSHFAFRSYFRSRGREEQPSYYSRPHVFDEIWRHYVRKWAKYKRVIWQVGLRGDVDRAVWKTDPSVPQSMEAAGKLISDAVNHQLRIIREETGDPRPPATMTLWAEGAMLYKNGYLQVPDHVIIVFANIPEQQRMNRDFHEVPRKAGCGYGVYHHNGFYYRGPHLAQGHSPEAVRGLLSQVAGRGDTAYAISNVQCLRELVLGAGMFARFTFDGPELPAETALAEWCGTMMRGRGAELAAAYKEYFAAYSTREDSLNPDEFLCKWLDGELREVGIRCLDKYPKGYWDRYDLEQVSTLYPEDPVGVQEEKILQRQLWLNNQVYPFELERCAGKWQGARERMEQLCQGLQGWERIFVQDNLVVQAAIMEGLSVWASRIIQAVKADRNRQPAAAVALVGEAALALQLALERRKLVEHDKFENWYGLDDKYDLEYMHKKTLEFAQWLAIPPRDRPVFPEPRGTSFDYIVHYRFNFNVIRETGRTE